VGESAVLGFITESEYSSAVFTRRQNGRIDQGVSPVLQLQHRGGEVITLPGCEDQILLKRQSHHANMVRLYFEEVYAREKLSGHRKMGDYQHRGNRAFHRGYLRGLRFTDCWLLNAIVPSAPELQTLESRRSRTRQAVANPAGLLRFWPVTSPSQSVPSR